MKVLVTGAKGMLGTDVCSELVRRGINHIATDIADLDLTDFYAIVEYIERSKPTHLINCAAYTAVDAAETNEVLAYRGNALTCLALAIACNSVNVPLLSVSTDFVFDGTKTTAYDEFDAPNPIGVYGKSKLEGEEFIRRNAPKHWIVRTSWLFGVNGKCFPDTIIKAAQARPELKVVADQRGKPTYTVDLAAAMVDLLSNPFYGTYHVSNSGTTDWHEFASEAVRLAKLDTPVLPITTTEYPTPAQRPANSALVSRMRELQRIPPLRCWKEALAEYVQQRAEAAERNS